MRRILAVSLTLVLAVVLLLPANASSLGAFNLSVYEKLPGYTYDKFDKTWSYYKAWSKEYSNAYVVIGLQAEGTSTGVNGVSLYAWIRDASNYNVLRAITSIDILVGDTLYSCSVYEGDTSSSTFLGEKAKPMIEAMSKANSISIRLNTKTGSMKYDIEGTEYSTGLGAAAKTFQNNHTIDFSLMGEYAYLINMMEEMYPIEVN